MSVSQSAAAAVIVPAIDPFAPLQAACDGLLAGFKTLPGYQPLALPSDLCDIRGQYGDKTLHLRASGFTAEGVAWGRVALIQGSGNWIANIVILTADHYTTPLLGLELLAFRERMHLIVADLFPLLPRDAHLMQVIGPHYDHVGPPPQMKPWARKIFSPHPVFRKPGTSEALLDGARAMREVGEKWLELARVARPETDPQVMADALQARAEYVRTHATDEPAIPFLSRTFGQEIGERLVNEVLFPVSFQQ